MLWRLRAEPMTLYRYDLAIATERALDIVDLTPRLRKLLADSGVQQGQMLIFNRHTTTALAINEYEPRLLEDVRAHLRRLAPVSGHYLHNDLDRRPDIPADEPINAHAHLMAINLHNHEWVPVVDGELGLGQYQSVLFLDLDGPRSRRLWVQIQDLGQASTGRLAK